MKQISEQKNTQYFKVGFAEKYYTLWSVTEHENVTSYSFVKNISMSRENVERQYPGVDFDENLRGKHGSFSVSRNEPKSSGVERYSVPQFVPTEGQVSVEHLRISYLSMRTAKNGRMYVQAEGINLDRPADFYYIISDFDGNVLSDVKVGDIINVKGTVSFFHDFTYYINDVIVEGKSEQRKCFNDNEKIDVEMTVISSNNSYVLLEDNNKRRAFIKLFQKQFRSDKIVEKYADCRDDFNVGNRLRVRATTKNVDGFYQLNYLKYDVLERATVNNERSVQFIHVKFNQVSGSGRNKSNVVKEYIFNVEEADKLVNFIYGIYTECGGRYRFENIDEVKSDIRKHIDKSIEDDFDRHCKEISFRDTQHTTEYIFRITCVMSR